jgi:hypothetical protein
MLTRRNIVMRMAETFTVIWLIAAALIPAKGSEAALVPRASGRA